MCSLTIAKSSTLKSLESLRIIAAIAVFFAHSGSFNIPVLYSFLGSHLFLGSIGVDIFFVISGFVMGILTMRTGSGFLEAATFIVNRVLRIFPLYALVTLMAVAYFAGIDKPWTWLHLFESLMFLPTRSASQVLDPIVMMGWTLRFEMYFYFLVASGIFFNLKKIVPAFGIVLSLGAWAWDGFYFGAPLVLEFLAGYLLSIYRKKLIEQVRSIVGYRLFVCGMAISSGVLLFATTGHDFGYVSHGQYSETPRLWIVYGQLELPRIIAWGIPSFLLVYSCIGLEKDFRWRIAYLGRYTYSVYLLQFFALIFARKLVEVNAMSDAMAYLVGAVFLAVSSFFSFHIIEFPTFKLRHMILRENRNFAS